ncbi:MAG: gliding motility-associated C-terminal domain-containing protein [Bacteroidia bacterium]|nr:gliding motility-associated C-terminal domain-containing protein [Bacteroidia bacterium]
MSRHLMFVIILVLTALQLSADTYYWVGDSGNWSDTTHWAISSGGSILHGDIPGSDDDVIFDQNSFINVDQEVIVDVARADMNNMDWQGVLFQPTFRNLSSNTLIINGDMTLSPGMNYAFAGIIIFQNAGTASIRTYDHVLGQNLYFDGPGADRNIIGRLQANNILYFRQGHTNITGDVQCKYLHIIPDELSDSLSTSFQGSILTTGNNTRSGSNPFETIKIAADYSSISFAPGSEIQLSNTNVTLRITGDSLDVDFPDINFSSNTGSHIILADPGSNHRFESIRMMSSGIIYRSSDIGLLELNSGRTYRFGSGQDYAIDQMVAPGTCENPIFLTATGRGSEARFSTNNSISGSYLNIRDIHVMSGVFQGIDSRDLGNIAGWDLTELLGQTLYWVGGTGDWQDQSHWSYLSGGPGGACIPTPIDNVVFDVNSFPAANGSVGLSADVSFCRNMTWTDVTNMPTFINAGKAMNISGSLYLSSNMVLDNRGILRFDAYQSDEEIFSGGQSLGRDVRIESIQGAYTLLDAFKVQGILYHVYGGLNSDGHDMQLVRYYSRYGTARSLSLDSSTVTLTAIPGLGANWSVNSDNFTLDAGTSTIRATSGISFQNYGSGTLQFNKVEALSTGNIYAYNSVNNRFRKADIRRSSFIFSHNQFDTLVLAAAESYEFSSGSVQTIGRLEAIGNCNQPINLRAQVVGSEAIFSTDLDDSDVRYTMIQDIHVQGNGRMENVAGVNNGNTTGWIINAGSSRDLYWVGNGGAWNDPGHWSLTSGGPGGECVPTSIDNVFFDDNSFDQNGQTVTAGNLFFRNMSWSGVSNQPTISWSQAYTYGSIELDDDINIQTWSWIRLLGSLQDRILDMRNKTFTHLVLNGFGDWTLGSDLNMNGELFIYNGGLSTSGNDIDAQRFRIWERDYLNINLDSSTIHLRADGASTPQFAQYQSNSAILDFDPGSSTINIHHPNGYFLAGSNEMSVHNLNFLATTGRGRLDVRTTDTIDYNQVVFNNNGLILQRHRLDSLVFAPGHTYTLHSGVTQVVNEHLEIMGSHCAPIVLNTTSIGNPATIQKVNGDVRGDYIEMRDQIGTGVSFNAGQHSTNVANSNSGWVFENVDDENPEVGFLGPNKIVCDDDAVLVNPYPYQNTISYSWNDGSNDSLRIFDTPGTYWVDATFDMNCTVRDTLEVVQQIYSNTDLGSDTTLCDGDSLVADVTITGGEYLWNDLSSDSIRTIASPGQYSVAVDYLGCPNYDTIQIDFNPIPSPDLGPDQFLCKDQSISLSPNVIFDDITWFDNSKSSSFTTSQTDTVWVDVEAGGCSARDSVLIQYFDLEGYLGADTTLCEGQLLEFNFDNEDLAYSWQDSSNQMNYLVSSPGVYSLELSKDGCFVNDSILISFQSLPTIILPTDVTICEGDETTVTPVTNGVSYEWSTGEATLATNLSEEGDFEFTSYLNGCSSSTYISVFQDTRPSFSLGVDTVICEQTPLYLTANVSGASFEWSDGSELFSKTVEKSGTYGLTVRKGACEVYEEISVEVKPCKEFAVYTPNVFSPDGDGKNDVFMPAIDPAIQVHEYKFMIFSRWGSLIFETEQLGEGWDGTVNGTALSRGTYIYTIDFQFTDELESGREMITGDVFLAR